METISQNGLKIHFPDSKMEQVPDTKNFPFMYIVRLQIKFPAQEGHGTGTLIGDRYILTAAHNVWNSTFGKATNIIAVPGQNGEDCPFGVFRMKRYFVSEEYMITPAPYPIGNGNMDFSRYMYDYALIELEEPVFKDNPIFPMVATDKELKEGTARIIGYPGDKPGGTMWFAEKELNADPNNGPFLFYRISTSGGDSGAAILKIINGRLVITGVHVAGSSDLGTNFGVRMIEEVEEQIKMWMNM